MRILFTCLVIAVILLSLEEIRAYDNFEGFLHDARCIKEKRRTKDDCNGNILDYCRPKLKGTNVNKADTFVFLFTYPNRNRAEFLHKCGGRLSKHTQFNPKYPTVMMAHGGTDGVCHSAWQREYRDQFFLRGKYNVILTDWTWGNSDFTGGAISNSKLVGEQLACVVNTMVKENGADPSTFHLIGNSYGCDILAVAGYNIPGLGRITGLDPITTNRGKPLPFVLDRSDAQLVDIIHTDVGNCQSIALGNGDPDGTADFYVNGGRGHQPACYPYSLISLLKGDILYGLVTLIVPMLCPHTASIDYFKASINPCTCYFVGIKCPNFPKDSTTLPDNCRSCDPSGDNCAIMGLDYSDNHPYASKSKIYYVDTATFCPYCDNSELKLNGFPDKPRKQSAYCRSIEGKQFY